MVFHLDRNLPISLTEQIKGQIKYAIAYGQYISGDQLPSVRELANQLDVAPMTIARVYRELGEESLIVSSQRSGTFVAELAHLNGNHNPSYQNLCQMLTTSVRQSRLMGHTLDEIKETFNSLVAEMEENRAPRTIILVANFKRATETYARAVEEVFSGMNIRVIPVVLSELKTNFSAYQEIIQKARLTITIPTRLNEVREILEPNYSRVVAVAFQLSQETRSYLAGLSPDTRLGIVTTYPEFLQPMLEGVHTFALLKNPPLCAIYGQAEALREMFTQIDALLYASGSEGILTDLPDNIRAVEFLHSPVPESLNRLRPFFF